MSYRLTPGGPYSRNRLPVEVKKEQGVEVYVRHIGGTPIRAVAAALGMSATTAWRRFWWYQDAVVYPELCDDRHRDHVPPQRSTRACPRGMPPILDRRGRRRCRHPLPSVPCRAHRSDGRPCRRWAIRGAAVCPAHGGRAPQVRRAAAERVRVAVEVDCELRVLLAPRGVLAPAERGMTVAQVRTRVLATPRSWMP